MVEMESDGRRISENSVSRSGHRFVRVNCDGAVQVGERSENDDGIRDSVESEITSLAVDEGFDD